MKEGSLTRHALTVDEKKGELVVISPGGRVLGSYRDYLENLLSAGAATLSPSAWIKRGAIETNRMEWSAPVNFFIAMDRYLTDAGWNLPVELEQRIEVLTTAAIKFFDAQIEIERRQTEIARQDAVQTALVAVGEVLAGSSLRRIFTPERTKMAADVILDAVAVDVASSAMSGDPESAVIKIKEVQKHLAEAAIQEKLQQVEARKASGLSKVQVARAHDAAVIDSITQLVDTAVESVDKLGGVVIGLVNGVLVQGLGNLGEGAGELIRNLIHDKENVAVFIGGGAVTTLVIMNRAGQVEGVAFANPGGWIIFLGFVAGGSLSALGWNVIEKGWKRFVPDRKSKKGDTGSDKEDYNFFGER